MKQILITGANSYIGTSLESWLAKYPGKYSVDTIDMESDSWRDKNYSSYDVVFHVAAVVHVKEKNIEKYFKVNRDLAIEVAQKAKQEGVKQFIFPSTMGVYGVETGYITKDIMPNPKTAYAKSKLEAEKKLLILNDEKFKVAILRPPIVYGRGCKGNYLRLVKLALRMPVFPDIKNERSMIYIDNLCDFIRLIIDNFSYGIFFPQNKEYVNTTQLVKLIRKSHGKEMKTTKIFNLCIKVGLLFSKTFKKVFGTFIYDKEMPGGPEYMIDGQRINYETISFEESIISTECNV